MARVTVEDCILRVPNRFELILLASQRAREISNGVPLAVVRDNDKNPIVALREIAENRIGIDYLKHSLIQSLRRRKSTAHSHSEQEKRSETALPEIDFNPDTTKEDPIQTGEVLSSTGTMVDGHIYLQEDTAALEIEVEAMAAEALRRSGMFNNRSGR